MLFSIIITKMIKLIILYSVLATAFARMGNDIDPSTYANIQEVRT